MIYTSKVSLTQEEIVDSLAESIRKKYPELAEEEFEITFGWDAYSYICTVSIEHA